jgi:hypothetical protein
VCFAAYGEEIDSDANDDNEDDLECKWESPCEDQTCPLVQAILELVCKGEAADVLVVFSW